MEFGRTGHIEKIDFSLPPDDPMTERLWQQLPQGDASPVRLYVGGTQWGNKDWVGKVYSKDAKEKDFLPQYVRQFNCIELNTLFYHLQPKAVIEKWTALAGKDFRFCPKFSGAISHQLQLKGADQDTDLFMDQVRHFGAALGPSFLQLSDAFGPDRAGLLQDYLRSLPRDVLVCVELRQEDWFKGGASGRDTTVTGAAGRDPADAIAATWEVMRQCGIGTVITDAAGRRDVVHMRLTAPVAFIRFAGNSLHPTDFQRIDAWADRIRTWIGRGLREIYFFVHNPDERYAPELIRHAVEKFNATCGTALKPPKLLQPPPTNLSLF